MREQLFHGLWRAGSSDAKRLHFLHPQLKGKVWEIKVNLAACSTHSDLLFCTTRILVLTGSCMLIKKKKSLKKKL